MCVQYMKIKSLSRYGQKAAMVPCGKCEECRDSARNQWFFRLRTELDWCHKHNFHIGFFTLTYAEDKIPRVPAHLIRNKYLIEECGLPYCFSRKHVRTFIDNIRKRCFEIVGKTKDDKRIRYMICSEFGSDPTKTMRSHYHGLICFPPEVKPEVMFQMIHHYWSEDNPKEGLISKGFVYPRDIRGGVDRHNHVHKPFLLVGDIGRAARYASKYCTKDLNFSRSLVDYDIDMKHDDYKDCKCFHIQSKSIGLSYLSQLPPSKLLDILKNGESFVGDTRRRSIPLYLKRKIFFNPRYSFVRSVNGDWYYSFEDSKWHYKKGRGTHRRVVEREATQFFKDNINAIYNMKKEYYVQLFKDMAKPEFWQARINHMRTTDVAESIASCTRYARELSKYNSEKLAVGYLSYYGVPYSEAKFCSPEKAYLNRFLRDPKDPLSASDDFEPWFDSLPSISPAYYDLIHRVVGLAIQGLQYCESTNYAAREKAKRVGDFYKHSA